MKLNKEKRSIGPEDDAEIQALIDSAVISELEKLSMNVVEPCEPECDETRHALHTGSWNAHLKIEDRIKELKSGGK